MPVTNKKILIVIGGGAAGFFCAINAARFNKMLQVVILEKSNKLLAKVKVSGGGRCNVTHDCDSVVEMSKAYPRGGNFVKKVFHHFFVKDTMEWFDNRGVVLKSEADGRMFPVTNSSQTIIDCLLNEAAKYNIDVRLQQDVKQLSKTGDLFCVETSKDIYYADFVCVATGGSPKIDMFNWLTNMGHSIAAPVPSLFTFNLSNHKITSLMGVMVQKVAVKIIGTKLLQQGPVLITHWGLSGPCVLRLSAWAARDLANVNWNFSILINWLPDFNEQTILQRLQQLRFEMAAQKVHHKNPFGLPARFWEFLLNETGVNENIRWADLPAKLQNLLVKKLCAYECRVNGKTTFKEEFVTAGGINLFEIDANTMMSKIVPNLYFAGEVIDVDGITGGYNFQNA